MRNNLTEGSVFKNVADFSVPYFVAYFLQTLYGMADLFIIGRFDGVAETTAVSIGSQVMHMLTVVIVGLAMGTTVGVAQAVGAGKKERAAFNIGNTSVLFSAAAVVLTVVLLASVKSVVAAMSTPSSAVAETTVYLTICFAGIPFITAYNVIASVFRGLGDSKSPMLFIAVACAANIVLDYVFIGVMDMGATGAALGTVLSQAVSVAVSLYAICRRDAGVSLKKRDFKIRKPVMAKLLRIGIPVALQDGFIQVAFIVITIIANRRGLTDAAAVGIVEKVIGFLFLVPSSMLSAVSALGAQNIGAKKFDRAIETLWCAMGTAVLYGALVSVATQYVAVPVVGAFTNDAAVAEAGGAYLRGYVWDCLFAGVSFCFSGYFCAAGRSELSFLHNIVSIAIVRVPGACLTLNAFPETLYPMGLTSPAGSLLSCAICLIAFQKLTGKNQNE